MPSSYSSNLLLELMADGENEGLWGDITNENLEILGRAAGGVGNISLAGTTHTLTVSQGQLSEGHYSVLALGGAPTGTVTVTINPNTVARTYVVKNDSGQDAVFTQGSGGNVTVANGETKILYSDGAGAGAAVTLVTKSFTDADQSQLDGALQGSELTSEAAVKGLDQGVATTDSPEFAGLSVDTDTLFVDTAGTRVGVNTPFPGHTLEVAGEFSVRETIPAFGLARTFFRVTADDVYMGNPVEISAGPDTALTVNGNVTIFDDLRVDGSLLLNGLTATVAELNHTDGVTSNIQNQLDGKITSVTAGNDLTGGGSSGSVTISHANTSNQNSVNNSGNTVIQDISLDSNGHVTNINSKTVGETFFESGEITIPSGGVVSVAHGLGSTPRFARVVLRCKSASRGFSVGDETTFGLDTGGEEGPAPIVHANSNNVFLNLGSSGHIRFIGSDDFFWGGSGKENFKLVFYAMK